MVKNVPHNNGRAGVFGRSYPGFYATMALLDAHPALKAVSPQAPVTDWYMGDDFHHNGALFLADVFGFFLGFRPAAPDADPGFQMGFPLAKPGQLPILPRTRPDAQYQDPALWRQHPLLERRDDAPQLRPVLAIAQPAAPSEKYQTRRAHRGRVLRRRRLLRPAQTLRGDRATPTPSPTA